MTPKIDFEVKLLSIDDIGDIMYIERACFSDPWSETGMGEYISSPYTLALGAVSEGKAVGCVMGTALYEDCEIANVAVSPQFRRQGVARAMLERFVSLCGERGVERMLLEVRESNSGAIGLYRGFGFEVYGRREKYYERPEEDALLMMLELEKSC